MTFQLKRLAVVLSLPLIISTASLVALSTSVFAQAADEGKEVLYWYDPMYPQQKFDEPGKSPFMDMDLVPRYADEGGDGASMTATAIAKARGASRSFRSKRPMCGLPRPMARCRSAWATISL